jgi:hypothetical protein
MLPMRTALTTSVTSRDPKGSKFMNTVAAAYDKAELTDEAAQLLNERGDEFTIGLQELIARYSTKAPDYTAAREILGNDFVTPEEIGAARPGVVYNPKQLLGLGNTMPSREVLEWCRDNGFMVVAGPARPTSLLDIRKLERGHFYTKEGGWYTADSEIFAKNDKATCRWLILRKEPVPGSTNKTWTEQEQVLSSFEVVPNAAEQVWGMTTYKAVRGVYLLPSVYVRTSSVDSYGDRVHVGRFGESGLIVHRWRDHDRLVFVGLSSSRK